MNEPFNLPLLTSIVNLTTEPTGFKAPESIIVTYNSTTRTVRLDGVVKAFYKGRMLGEFKKGWTSPAHPNVVGNYFLRFDGSSVLWSTTPWSFSDLQICFVRYGTTDKFGTREIHSFLQHQAHNIIHNTIGTYKVSGGTLSDYTPASTVAANRRPNVSSTNIQDEDLLTNLVSSTSKLYTKMYLTGSGVATFSLDTADICYLSSSTPSWNEWNGSSWAQTPMAVNSYSTVWLIGIPVCAGSTCQKYRFVWIQGQSNGSLASQQSLTPGSLNLGDLTTIAPEFVALSKVIIRFIGGDWSITQVDTLAGGKLNQFIQSTGGLTTVAVDGTTITGDGTIGNPLVALSSGDVVGDDTSTTAQNIVAYSGVGGKNITELTGTQGDILYHNGTSWQKLGAGTSGYCLRTQGASANPAWKPCALYNQSTGDQGAGFATDTYITGSSILVPTGSLKVGSRYYCMFRASKTAAGSATAIINIRFGTNGTTADTSRGTLTWTAGTAAIDDGVIEVWMTVTTSGSSGVIRTVGRVTHKLSVTGLTGTAAVSESEVATSGTFDMTGAGNYIGLSLNAGTSAVWTLQMVQSKLENLI